MADEALMEAFNDGHHRAFAIGYDRWRSRLAQAAWYYLRRAEDVHDAVQQTLLKIYSSHIPHCPSCREIAATSGGGEMPVGQIPPKSGFQYGSFEAWMCTILRRVVIDMQRRGIFIGTSNTDDFDIADHRQTDIEHSILLSQVRKKCQSLSTEDERALMLDRLDGKTIAQIAKERHRPISAIHKEVHQGIEHLRNALGIEKK